MTVPGSAGDQPLDFSSPTSQEPANPHCSSCKAEIKDQYWSVGPAILCASCREVVERGQTASTEVTARTGRFTKAFLFGFGGMLAGATIWYLIAKLANLEVGLIAILLGYLVGKGVFIGSGKRGGRRYQVMAVLLTYLGIGLAYVPFALEGIRSERSGQADSLSSATSSTAQPTEESGAVPTQPDSLSPDSASSAQPSALGLFAALGIAIGAILTLPVMVTVGGLPGSLISLLIYGFAIMEAWKLTREARLKLSGPFKVGGTAPA